MKQLKMVVDWMLLAVASAVVIMVLGLWARLAKTLFCVGYGC
jgi:hypothetical protein